MPPCPQPEIYRCIKLNGDKRFTFSRYSEQKWFRTRFWNPSLSRTTLQRSQIKTSSKQRDAMLSWIPPPACYRPRNDEDRDNSLNNQEIIVRPGWTPFTNARSPISGKSSSNCCWLRYQGSSMNDAGSRAGQLFLNGTRPPSFSSR